MSPVWISLLLSVIALAYFMARQGRSRRKEKAALFLKEDQEGFLGANYDISLLGAEGKTLCDLLPTGEIEIKGTAHQAIAEYGFVLKGERVIVMGGHGFSLVVKKLPSKRGRD